MPLVGIIAVALWFFFGDPAKNVANWFWGDTAAPWEEVDAFYYPKRSDLSKHLTSRGLHDVDACRRWVYAEAFKRNDDRMTRGDYECGIGLIEHIGGLKVYRITVR